MLKLVLTLFVGFLLLGIQQNSLAEGDITFSGRVKDAYSKTALEDVHIIIKDLQKGTTTNRKGYFSFKELSAGSYTITITHIGYLDHEQEVVLESSMDEMLFLIRPRIIQIDPVTITGTLTERQLSLMPARVSSISAEQIEQTPANSTDDLLRGVANVYVHRPWGIYSKSASVTMRGLPGSSRTLIMLDGVPMNKVSGGAVNWNFIEPTNIENIEVVKGPGSAIYGNNAMSGVINMTTKKPVKNLDGKISAFGGSLGTYGGALMLGGNKLFKARGLYWKLNGFMRGSDGYINEPEETSDEYDTKLGLDQYNAGALMGYRFDSTKTLDVSYRYYNGKFGTGIKICEDDGSFDHYTSHLLSSAFEGQAGKYKINTRLYYQQENLTQQAESMSSSEKYKLSDTETVKHDLGLWFNISRTFFRNHLFTAGVEAKRGDMDAKKTYRTSTDDVRYGGALTFTGLFLQDEFHLFKKLSVIAGLRFDYALFSDGFQEVLNPTSNTGFIQDKSVSFEDESWYEISPKIALQYQIRKNLGLYASVSSGFMPPKIDDLVKSGKISKGFKLANPELKPETLVNYELGLTWMLYDKLSIEPSAYYSRGYDFQYFVATGDSVETGGSDLKPVLQRQNITDVEIAGAEITATWIILDNLVLAANYSFNHSEILEFRDPANEDKDITGNGLIEVPQHMANASLAWQNKIIDVMFNWHYLGKEWYDDENTQYIEPHHLLDLKLSKTLPQKIGFTLTIQNILDDMTIDRKGKLPPGRFVIFEVAYEI